MRKGYVLILLLFFFSALTAQTNNKELNALFNQYQEELYKLSPLSATANGVNKYNDQLPITFTDSYQAKYAAFYKKYLAELSRFKRESLNDNDKLSYDVFKWQTEIAIEGLKFKGNRFPITQFGGIHQSLAQSGSGTGSQPFKTVKDYENWLSRANKFPEWTDSIIAYFRKGMAEGIVLPKALAVKIIPQLESHVVSDITKSVFYGPVKNFPASFSGPEKEYLTEAYTKLITENLIPSYQKLATFIKEAYLPATRTTSGLGSLPGGKEWYAYNVKAITTTNKTPDEIYNIGLAEVKRIRAEMDKVKGSVGYTGTLNEFLEYMRTDKKFYPYKSAEEILAGYRAIEPKIAATLKTMFVNVPKTSFEIRQTEAFRAASAAAQYNSGLADGSRAGIFYVPIVDATQVKVRESLFIHEAIPGHHYQIMLQKENMSLPEFRRNGGFTSYAEGWGLYSESLGKELGLYTDPYQYMMALGDEIHRAIRLVVDPGMHVKGWTREQAIQYMMENEPITEQAATAEIERYMAIAGQAVAYKIGALKIQELRNKYTKQLGNKFSLASFHNEILKDGALPLDLLERKLNAWAKKVPSEKTVE
jgi:uncharacterized protein (DUF885 family)